MIQKNYSIRKTIQNPRKLDNQLPLYKLNNKQIQLIKENPYSYEKEIQSLFENNLTEVTNLTLIKSEFTIKNRRIDTLAFDPETNGFVIIEYKKDKNFSVIDQGFAYLGLMLENIAEFIVEYNENSKTPLKRNEFDSSQSRIMFVSTGFTITQIQAANFKDIAIELWEVKRFDNDTIIISKIKKTSSAESIKPITSRNENLKSVSTEIFVPTEDNLTIKGSEITRELFFSYKNAILNIDDGIDTKFKKQELGFLINGKIFADVYMNKSFLKIMLNIKRGELNDPLDIARDVSEIGTWGNGDYRLELSNNENFDYNVNLIKQSLIINSKRK